MHAPLRLRVTLLRSSLAGSLLLALAACQNEGSPRRGSAEATEVRAARPPVPELEAHGMFFANTIEIEVLLSSGGFAPRPVASAGGSRGGGGRGGFSGGFGGGRGRGGGGGRGRGGESPEARGARAGGDGQPAPNIRASNEPPVQFHLRLTNHGAEVVEIEVSDFNSDLGNFVVLPRKIPVPAGESVEAEPMTSRLGVTSTEIPLVVALRVNSRAEQQTLTLHVKPASAPTDAAAPAAAPAPAATPTSTPATSPAPVPPS